ncbi:MAG: hypothetical protein L6R42_004784, partial [Xanthoria sp. 1 TBL-2021]
MDATSATGSHQQPPSQEHTREEAKMYAQASSYIAGFDQRRDLMTTKRPHSPAPVPAPASSVGYQQVGGRLAIEPPPNSPRVMANHMGIRSIPGPDQQAGVSHNQQPQAWQKAVTHYLPTTQQQAQLGPSAFANGPTTSVVSPSQPCPWAAGQLPEGQRPSEAIVSEKQDTSGSLTNAEPLAATTKSQAQGQRFPPGLYLNPRNPLNTYSLSKTQKPTGRRLTKLERSKLSQQQQQSISYEAAHGPTVSERQQPNSAEVAETSSPSLNNMEQQRPGTFLRTSGAQIAPVIPAQRIAQMMPRTHGLPMPQTPPQSLASSQQQKIQADSAAYINQCYGISPTQGQDQEQSPSPDPADQVNPYSTPKPTVQTPAQQNSASDTTLEPIDKPIAQMKKEEHTAFASPLSETDESEVVEKSISGITKHRLPAGGSPEEPIHVIDGDSN